MSFYEMPTSRHNSALWGAVEVQVLEAGSAEELTTKINNVVLNRQMFNVLAVSAATVMAEPHIAREYIWTSTVILQARCDPNGGAE